MQISKLLLVVAVCIAFLALYVHADSTAPFVLSEFLPGEWDLIYTKFDKKLGTPVEIYPENLVHKLFLFKNETQADIIMGHSFFNNTETSEVTDHKNVVFTMSPAASNMTNTGVLDISSKIQSTDDNTTSSINAPFSFGLVANIALAQGVYTQNKTTNKQYQWTVPNNDRFIVTIKSDTTIDDDVIVVGRRVPVVAPKTFWQSYGTYLLMFCLMGFNMWMQSRQRNMAPEDAALEQQQNGQPTVAAASSSAPAQATPAQATPAQATPAQAAPAPAKAAQGKTRKAD